MIEYNSKIDKEINVNLSIKRCLFCNNEFVVYRNRGNYCSTRCRNYGISRTCQQCDVIFVKGTINFHGHAKYCSYQCRNLNAMSWNKGLTKETDERVRQNGINSKKGWEALIKNGYVRISHPSDRKGKTHEEIFGIEQSKIIKQAVSEKLRGVSFEDLMGAELAALRKTRMSRGQELYWAEHPDRRIIQSENGKKLFSDLDFKARFLTSRNNFWNQIDNKTNTLQKIFSSLNIKPNKIELRILQELKNINQSWQFVGDGTLWIGGKNPDFWNQKNKLIEYYGTHWHLGDNMQDRINYFLLFGFSTIIILEDDIRKKGLSTYIKEKMDFLK